MIFLLILLPFTFIEFFYAPWMQAQAEARAPRQLPAGTSGHVILTAYEPVTASLMRKLDDYGYPYVLLVGDLQEALRLHDLGVRVLFGEVDRPETYCLARAEQAAMVARDGQRFREYEHRLHRARADRAACRSWRRRTRRTRWISSSSPAARTSCSSRR